MKLAVVHCWTAQGGALEVCKDLIKEELDQQNFDDIQFFSTYSEIKKLEIYDKKININTALPKLLNRFFIRNSKHKLPILGQIFDYRNLMFFYIILMKVISRKIKNYKPDKILISSFAIAKNIEQCKTGSISKRNIKTTLYIHSPMQYIRSHAAEYKHKLTGRKGILFKIITPRLKKRDLKYTSYDKVYSNSKYTKEITKEIYNIDSELKYPKLNQIYLNEKIVETPKEYIVYIGRVVKFVRETDIIIKAFNKIGYPLIIIGSGPDEKELKILSKGNITFKGWNPPDMIDIIKNAKGAINLTKESFGMSTAESMCLGIPVLGYNKGATPELVDQKSGILIDNKSEKEIIKKFETFISQNWDRNYISNRARKIFTSK